MTKILLSALIALFILTNVAEARGGGHAYGSHSGSHGGGSHSSRGHR